MTNTIETLSALVGFPTLAGGPNLDLMGWLQQRLSDLGAHVRVMPGTDANRINLWAKLGPDGPDGILLSAHEDVVPVAGQAWTTDPFRLREGDGKLFGRGSVDMKGFLACMVTAAETASRLTLRRPLHLAISHDEEIGCVGVRPMLQAMAAEGFRARACIVGEPTGLVIATGHKGKVAVRVTCQGQAAHSANPGLGVNAIGMAAAMVAEVEAVAAWLAEQGVRDKAYAVPHGTAQVGTISGGTALNIVPAEASLAFEIRFPAGEDYEALLIRLRDRAAAIAAARGGAISIAVTNAYPGLAEPETSPAVALATLAGGSTHFTKLDFGTEAGLFRDMLGLPSVVCGPGSIDRAHKPDEFITRDELAAGDAFLTRVVESLV
ncbi:acetylornithine deacetylase [Acidisoma cellulosilytica]|uniref:Acetylornithine deacetylase n=1 Tax=Acidisoma cellulosilyticum TaxID=2802395 RepID=A0A963Z035_9PROT|nr:acetylornithine deacetylase [Acidisoma cellulosilyticum]MCB8880240.1 acetylornithine deacetylase [Acidisoma cellulosilyticum]